MALYDVIWTVLILLVWTCWCQAESLELCPQPCTCDNGRLRLTCSEQGLAALPRGIPATIQHADMHGNNLTELDKLDLPSLVSLDASSNALTMVHPDAFSTKGQQLQQLNLADNELTDEGVLPAVSQLTQLTTLNLSNNSLTFTFKANLTEIAWPSLQSLDLSYNLLTQLPVLTADNLHTLNLSHNHIHNIDKSNLTLPPRLHILDLSHNDIQSLHNSTLQTLENLQFLDISHNGLLTIQAGAFSGCSALQQLHLSHLTRLWYIDEHALADLDNLTSLDLSYNPALRHIPATLLQPCSQLTHLHLEHSGLIALSEQVTNISSLESVWLQANPWLCDCHIVWLAQQLLQGDINSTFKQSEPVTCAEPAPFHALPLQYIPITNLTCHAPGRHLTQPAQSRVYFPVGGPAVLNCVGNPGQPLAVITWTSPRGVTWHYEPAYGSRGILPPHHTQYHTAHEWHETAYDHYLNHEERVHVLSNGSLYIDYVQRSDAGHYHCYTENWLGNASSSVQFLLDYNMHNTYFLSLAAGAVGATLFLMLGLLLGLVRRLLNKCSKERSEKRHLMQHSLATLEIFKTTQIDKLNAFSTSKFDKLTAYKSAKVDQLYAYKTAKSDQFSTTKTAKIWKKFTGYSKVPLATFVQYSDRMREYYRASAANIHDNCTENADRVKSHYAGQKDKLRHYVHWEQGEHLRNNYSMQMTRIRDYGQTQLEKLRLQYKMQQEALLKIFEIMDIGNCLSVIEADAMHAESQIFDQNLLDLEVDCALPEYMKADCDTLSSEYDTASSSSNLRRESDGIPPIALPFIDFDLIESHLPPPDLPQLINHETIARLPQLQGHYAAPLTLPELVLDPHSFPPTPIITQSLASRSVAAKNKANSSKTAQKSNKKQRQRKRSRNSDIELGSSDEEVGCVGKSRNKHCDKHRKDKAKSGQSKDMSKSVQNIRSNILTSIAQPNLPLRVPAHSRVSIDSIDCDSVSVRIREAGNPDSDDMASDSEGESTYYDTQGPPGETNV